MIILHLSDLHFGYDQDDTMKAQRKIKLDALSDTVCDKGIDTVLITGDIAWRCKESGYLEAYDWITSLLEKLSLASDRLIVCAGNHDLDHSKCIDMDYQANKESVSKSLRQERIKDLSERFHRYNDWCSTVGAHKYKLGDNENYFVGSITLDGVDFWGFNSAWYAFKGGEEDKGKLWIGDSFVDCLIADKGADTNRLRFALHHHPPEWINENETLSFSQTSSSLYRKLSRHVKVVFTGHTHALQGPPNKYENRLYSFGTGATYADNRYSNCFCIYNMNLERNELQYTPYIIEDDSWVASASDTIELSCANTVMANHTVSVAEISETSAVSNYKQILENNGFTLIKVNASDFLVNRTIIWPVVPRLNLNNIHLAQLELMEQLVKSYGWKVLAIISNCGARPLPEDDTNAFIDKIKKRCDRIGIENIAFELLKDYFNNKPAISNEILQSFMKVSSSLPISELTDIKEKKYDDNKRAEIQHQPVLDYILPVLQYAVIKQISDEIYRNEGKRSVVIAGNDEKYQWRRAVNIIGDNSVGAILIPELNNPAGQNIAQDTDVPNIRSIIQCSSKDELKDSMQIDSVAQWFYRMFIFLSNHENISKADIYFNTSQNTDESSIWREEHIPDYINRDKLIDCVWSRIDRDI